jgi:hypothetical protein
VRDVVSGEDAHTTPSGTAPQAFAAIRNVALSLLHRWRHRNLTAAREDDAGHPAALFRRLQLAPAGLWNGPGGKPPRLPAVDLR